jgi:hypothetical protein
MWVQVHYTTVLFGEDTGTISLVGAAPKPLVSMNRGWTEDEL